MPQLLLALALLAAPAAPAPAPAAPPSDADPEVEVLATNLLPAERAGVEKATGGLAHLPRYRVELAIDPGPRTFTVKEQLRYEVPPPQPLEELFFRIVANTPLGNRDLPVRLQKVRLGKVELDIEPTGTGIYRVSLNGPRAPGDVLSLELELAGRVPELQGDADKNGQALLAQAMAMLQGTGFMGVGEEMNTGLLGASGDTVLMSGFFAEVARIEAPGAFDTAPDVRKGEPRWSPLANYVLSVVAPQGYAVAGTGTEIGRTPERDGRQRTTRVAAATRGVALAISTVWQEQKATAGGVQLRVLAPKKGELQGKKVLDVATRALGFFSDKLGAYPWANLDLVAVPLGNGDETASMPQFVAFSSLLADPTTAAAMAGMTGNPQGLTDTVLELLIAHHVAHQWFRGIVGDDHQAHPALDEPLASYLGVAYHAFRRGPAAGRSVLDAQARAAYQMFRALGQPDQAIDRPIAAYGGRMEREAMFFGKGTHYYAALRALVGDAVFFKALKAAVQEHRFGFVETDPLLPAIATLAPAKAPSALKLHDRWFEKAMGDNDLGHPERIDQLIKKQGVNMDPQTRQLMQQMMQGFGGGATGP